MIVFFQKPRTTALVILAAVIFWLLFMSGCADSLYSQAINPEPVRLDAHPITPLIDAYNEYNREYFSDKLPHDVILDWVLTGDTAMAATDKTSDDHFRISFNWKYNRGSRQLDLNMLHEQCHIKTWQMEPHPHGKKWRACMTNLDSHDAFRDLLIDQEEQDEPVIVLK